MSIPDRIRRIASDPALLPTVRIGRSGLTENIVTEVRQQLSTRLVVKVRINRGVANDRAHRKALLDDLAEQTGTTLVDDRGNTGVFWKP